VRRELRSHAPRTMRAVAANLMSVILVAWGQVAAAGHIAREDPAEPIFTERAFLEKNLEFDIGVDRDSRADTLEFSPSVTWIFFKRLQLGAEIPIGLRRPDEGTTRASLSDIGFSAQWLFCCERKTGFEFLSARVDIALPTGDRSAEIGGTGDFAFSLLGGYGLTVFEALDDLGIQVQLAYDQELHPSKESTETAVSRSITDTTEKSVLWNIAFNQPLFGNRFSPTLEILGTTVFDATLDSDEETRVDLAGGALLRPFPDDHWGSPITIGAGWRFPVSNRGDFRGQGLLFVEWAFD
jgi:hypothetical protein